MYPCVMNCNVIICVVFAFHMPLLNAGWLLITSDIEKRPPVYAAVFKSTSFTLPHVLSPLPVRRHMSPICERVGGFAHNVVEDKRSCNFTLMFKISVIQVLLRLQKGAELSLKYWVSLTDSNKMFLFNFWNHDHQR